MEGEEKIRVVRPSYFSFLNRRNSVYFVASHPEEFISKGSELDPSVAVNYLLRSSPGGTSLSKEEQFSGRLCFVL